MFYIFIYYKEGKLYNLHVEAINKEIACKIAKKRAEKNRGLLLNKRPVGSYIKK